MKPGARRRPAVTLNVRDLASIFWGDLSPARSVAAPKHSTPPPASVSPGRLPRVVGAVGVPREVAIVSVEHQPYNPGPLGDVQCFLEELAGRPVRRDHNEKSVHPFLDDPTIGDRHEWRGVGNDVVVPLPSPPEPLPPPGPRPHLVGGRRQPARWADRKG